MKMNNDKRQNEEVKKEKVKPEAPPLRVIRDTRSEPEPKKSILDILKSFLRIRVA
jgi:hypothetical protein